MLYLAQNRDGVVAGSCERGNKPLGFIKIGEFLDRLNNC